MVVVMTADATAADVDEVVSRVAGAGGQAFVSRGESRTVVGLVGDSDRSHGPNLRAPAGVMAAVRVSTPYKLVSREHHTPSTVVVGDAKVPIGPGTFTLIAGPCAVESPEQTLQAAQMAAA